MPPMRKPGRKVVDVLAPAGFDEADSEALTWLGRLLMDEGTDLETATFVELERGTPVYVRADADIQEVQRLMARNHIRSVTVLSGERPVGILDLVELAGMEQAAI